MTATVRPGRAAAVLAALVLAVVAVAPAFAASELRLVAPSDTVGSNYVDRTVARSGSTTLELWAQADTNVNGLQVAIAYDRNRLAVTSFTPDTSTFGDTLQRRLTADSLAYAVLVSGSGAPDSSVTGSYRIGTLTVACSVAGTCTLAFDSAWTQFKITAMTGVPTGGRDVLAESGIAQATDSGVLTVVDTSLANAWYVNDTSLAGDSFTTAIGYDTASGLSASEPKRTLNGLETLLSAGDTVYVDSGWYYEADTVTAFDTNSLWLIGVDSAATRIRLADSSVSAQQSIFCTGVQRLSFRNVRVSNAVHGIVWMNVDSSTLDEVAMRQNNASGIYMGFGASNDTFTGNLAQSNGQSGFRLANHVNSRFTRNVSSGNGNMGWNLTGSTGNTFETNTASGNSLEGFSLTAASSSNVLYGNAVSGNGNDGFEANASSNQTIRENTVAGNAQHGLFFNTSNNNLIESNVATGNAFHGIILDGNGITADNNAVLRNLVVNNLVGITLDEADNNVVRQNTVDSNAQEQIRVSIGSAGDTVEKNVILPSPTNPDSGLRNATGNALSALRNWFGSTDTTVISGRIYGGGETLVAWVPFRLGIVDTSLAGDSVAPRAPDTVAAMGTDPDRATVSWAAVTLDEEGDSYATSLAGYRVWRATTANTSVWALAGTAGAATTAIQDSGLAAGTTYYYKVTAFDSWTIENQSFYSDSTPWATTLNDTVLPNVWYVNDTSTAGDAFCADTGQASNNGLTAATPKRSLNDIERWLTAGDTVYVDSGWYYEADSIVIETGPVWILGADSRSTIVDFLDSGPGTPRAFWSAPGVRGLVLQDFAVRNAFRAFWLYSDSSTMRRLDASQSGGGIFLEGGDSNEVSSCYAARNDWTGFLLSGAARNLLSGNRSWWNAQQGFLLGWGSESNVLTGNVADSNVSEGFKVDDCDTNTLAGNTADSSGLAAFSIVGGSQTNLLTGNTVRRSRAQGVWIAGAGTVDNTITGTTIDSPASAGVYLNADRNTVRSSTIDSPASYGIQMTGASMNVIETNTVRWATNIGIYLTASSDTNTLRWNEARLGTATDGIKIEDADSNLLEFCTTTRNFGAGFAITGTSSRNLLRNCASETEGNMGFWVSGGGQNTFESASVRASGGDGFSIRESNDAFRWSSTDSAGGVGVYVQNVPLSGITLTGNRALRSAQQGFVVTGALGCLLETNVAYANANDGFMLNDTTTGCTLVGNEARGNGDIGFLLYANCDRNIFSGNKAETNASDGFLVQANGALTCDTNEFHRNLARRNGGSGFKALGSTGNLYEANRSDSNAEYQVNLDVASTGNVLRKNDLLAEPGDTNAAYVEAVATTMTRNWWGTTDSGLIGGRLTGAGRPTALYAPWRLGEVDTAADADTVAPRAPDSVAATASGTSTAQVSWAAVGADEENDPYATGLAGYRIWRSPTSDTTVWAQAGTAGAATTSISDSGLAQGTTYYWRVTAFDGYATENQSFYSDSIATATTPIDTTGPNAWYVNDTSTAGDSFTTAVGYDTQTGLFPNVPKRTLNALEGLLTPGDTIYVDSGWFYEADTFTIDTNSIWLLGVDSTSTVIDFNDSTAVGARAVYAPNVSRLTIRDLRVTDGRFGVWLSGTDTSTIERVRSDSNGFYGFILEASSEWLTFRSNIASGNGSYGMYFFSTQFDTIMSNVSTGNAGYGIYFFMTTLSTVESNVAAGNANHGILFSSWGSNVITSNVSTGNAGYGFWLQSSDKNQVRANVSSGNAQGGFWLNLSDEDLLTSNTADSNAGWGFRIDGGSIADTLWKNVWIPQPAGPAVDSALLVDEATWFTATRNWWGTIDSSVIRSRIDGSADTVTRYIPYRLGIVDTSLGGDSVAPRAPDTVAAASAGDTTIRVSWAAVSLDEEADGFATNLTGYRIYRSRTPDTSLWVQAATAGAATTQIDDSSVLPGAWWYYKVTAFDNATYVNESFFSDSTASATTVDTTGPNRWYVNNAVWNASDSFTTAAGDTANAGLIPSKPAIRIDSVVTQLTAGDTVYVDAGTFNEYDTITIGVGSVWILGVDSSLTVVDFNNVTASAARSVAAETVQGLTLRDFAVRRGYLGVSWSNVDASVIQRVSAESCGVDGIEVVGGSTNDTLIGNTAFGNGADGFYLFSSGGNYLQGNLADSNDAFGFNVDGTGGATNGVTLLENLAKNNRNTAGFQISWSSGHTVTSNTSTANGFYGFWFDSVAASVIAGNRSADNANGGFAVMNGGTDNAFTGNVSDNDTNFGVWVSDVRNRLERNVVRNNRGTVAAYWLTSGNNTLLQNTADSNAAWALWIDIGAAASDSIRKNVFLPSPYAPDSGAIVYDTTVRVDLLRNWWGTTDSQEIDSLVWGLGDDSATYVPYRLGIVDTSLGGDSVAPRAPDTVAAASVGDTTIRVSWAATSLDEEADGFATNLAGYRVWRSPTPDTSLWVQAATAGAATTQIDDSGVAAGTWWYYKVTAFDNATYVNESFFSDSTASATTVDTTGANRWYVNDSATTGDSFTTAIGYDTAAGLSPSTPARRIGAVLPYLTAGDTVYVDSGVFYDTIAIRASAVSFIGKDSLSTIVDGRDSYATGNIGCTATGVTRLLIQGIGFTQVFDAITLTNVDTSVVERCRIWNTRASGLGDGALLLQSGAAANVVRYNWLYANQHGIKLNNAGATGNQVLYNLVENLTGSGINASGGADGNTITYNTVTGCAQTQIGVTASSGNLILGNVVSGGAQSGIQIFNVSTGNVVAENVVTGHTFDGIWVNNNSSGNVVRNNLSRSNGQYGIAVTDATDNLFYGNSADSNASYAYYIGGTADADTFTRNTFVPSLANPDSGIFNATTRAFSFARNWFGTTDSAAIRTKVRGPGADSIAYTPFRLGTVDTAANADTVAPRAPDTVTAVATASTTAVVSWGAVSLDEEGDSYATNLAGYRIWRSKTADTSLWAQAATAGAATTYVTDSGLQGGVTYYYRVTAFDNSSIENQSFYSDSIASVATAETQPPDTFVLTAPAQGTETNLATVVLRWSDAADSTPPVQYVIRVSTLASFASYVESDVAANTSAAVSLAANETWHWRVIARDAGGNTRVSSSDSTLFVDTALPTAFVRATPVDGFETSATDITLTWTTSTDTGSGVDSYLVQVSTVQAFTYSLVDTQVDGADLDVVVTVPGSETWFWRVIAVDEATNTRAAGPTADSSFIVDTTPPAAFTLTAPAADTGVASTSVGFSWTATADTHAGLNRYVVQVSTISTFATLRVDSSTGTTPSTTLALPANDTYWWRVFAFDDAGNSAAASPASRMFIVDTITPPAFSLVAPADAHETFSGAFLLDWADAADTPSGLERYEVEISTSATFGIVFSTARVRLSESAASFASEDTYYWRVIAVDTAGNRRASSETWSVVVDSTPPVLATIVAASSAAPFLFADAPLDTSPNGDTVWFQPDSGAVQTCTVTVTFVDARPGTFSASPAFGDAPADDATSPYEAVYTIEAGAAGADDTLTVRDLAGSTDAALLRFRADSTFPTPAAQTSPAESAVQGNTTVTFQWSAATDTQSGVARYQVQAATSATFALLLVDSTTVATSLVATVPVPDTYWWRVIAVDSVSNANTAAATSRNFRVDTSFPVVTLLSVVSNVPAAFDESTPVGVTDAGDTVWFGPRAQVCTITVTVTDDNDSLVVGDSVLTPVDYLDAFDGDETYVISYLVDAASPDTLVRVVATDILGFQDTVPVWFIRDSEPPVAVALSGPASGHETSTTSVTFSWGATADTGSGLAAYRLQASTDPAFGTFYVDSATGLSTSGTLSLAANETWSWRVVASDDVGNTGVSTETRVLVLDTAPPDAFLLNLPPEGTETSATTVTFTWSASGDTGTGVNRYRLMASTLPSFAYLAVDSSTGLSTSGARSLAANETYAWRVWAYDDAGNTRAAGDSTLLVDTAAPSAFMRLVPADGTETRATSIAFRWQAATDGGAGVDSYTLQVSTSQAFGILEVDTTVDAAETEEIVALVGSETWYWRVTATDAAGNTTAAGPTADSMLLVDTTTPAAFTLASPADGASTTAASVFLTWNASSDTLAGLVEYRLQFATSGGFASTTADSSLGVATNTTTPAPADTTYWRLVAVDAAGNTTVSDVRRFTRDGAPPASFNRLVPADGLETSTTSIAFRWEAAVDTGSGLDSYTLQVSTSQAFGILNVDTTVDAAETEEIVSLAGSETWYWRLVARDVAGNTTAAGPTADSMLLVDTTTPALFTLVSPPDGADTSAATTILSWNASSDTLAGLSTYRLQFSTSAGFATLTGDSSLGVVTNTTAAIPFDTIYWRLVAVDAAGNTTASDVRSITRDSIPPAAFNRLAPPDGVETSATTFAFRWQAASDTGSGVDSYTLQVSTSVAFAILTVDTTVDAAVTEDTVILVGAETWYWRVVARDAAGNLTASGPTTESALVVDTASPAVFLLQSPAQGAETRATTVAFNWSGSSDALTGLNRYRFLVSTLPTFAYVVYDSSTGTVASTTTALPANDTYWWRVTAYDDAGNTRTAGDSWLVVDATPPTAFAFDTPTGATRTTSPTTLSWQAATDLLSGLDTYLVLVDSDPAFGTPETSAVVAAGDTDLSIALAVDTWYWRVTAYDQAGNTRVATAGVETFAVASGDAQPPDTFYQVSPASGFETSGTSLTFVWTAAADTGGLQRYRLQVSTASAFTLLLVDSDVAAANTSAVRALAGSETYHWRVVAVDLSNNTTVSRPGDSIVFVDTTPPSAFALAAPAYGAETSAASIAFSWAASSDVLSGLGGYALQISTDAAFSLLAVDSVVAAANTFAVRSLVGSDTYHWRVVAFDDAGNTVLSSETRTLVVDTTAPAVFFLTYPAQGHETTAATTAFTWAASSDVQTGLNRYRILVDNDSAFGSPLADSSTGLTANTTLALAVNDTWYWRVLAYDDAGNTRTAGDSWLVVDTTPPAAFGLVAPEGGHETFVSTFALSWGAATDALSGLNRYRIFVDNDPAFGSPAVDSSGTTTNTTVTLPANDTYLWRVWAYDDAGNTRAAGDSQFLVDATTPGAFTLDTPILGANTTAATVRLDWTDAADTLAGVGSYRVQVATSAAFSPLVRDGVQGAVSETSVALSTETYFWRVYAIDQAGNSVAATNVPETFVVSVTDTTSPALFRLDTPVLGTETSATTLSFGWTASSDTGSGLNRYQFRVSTLSTFAYLVYDSSTGTISGTTVALPANDTYYWRVTAYDNAGNTATAGDSRLVVDTASPTAFLLSTPAEGAETSTTSVAFTWAASTDTQSGLNRYRFVVSTLPTFAYLIYDSSTGTTASTTTALPANDTYWWRVTAYDDAGNTRTAAADSWLAVDTTPPTAFNLTYPAQAHETSAATTVFTWSASSDLIAGLNRYRILVDNDATFGSPAIDSSTGTTANTTLALPASDTWYWRVLAYDDAGNTRTAGDSRLVVDAVPPAAFALTYPDTGHETAAATIAFTWGATTDSLSGLNRYQLQTSTSSTFALLAADSATGTTAGGTLTLAANDTYYWRVLAIDDAGNTRVSTETRPLLVDQTTPGSFTLDTPILGANTTAASVRLDWADASDTLAGVSSYRVQVSTAAAFTLLVRDGVQGAVSETSIALSTETYYWRVFAIDQAGNSVVAANQPGTFAVVNSDTTKPAAFTLLAPADSIVTNVPFQAYVWTASSDTGTGLAGYRFQVSTSTAFTPLAVDASTGLATNTALALAANETWHWRVVAYDVAGNSTVASPTWRRITLDTVAPTVPVLVDPTLAETTFSPVTLRWAASTETGSGLSGYRIQVSTLATFAYLVTETRTLPSDTDVALSLAFETYWWRAAALDSAGNEDTSASTSFRILTETTSPLVSSPAASDAAVANSGSDTVLFTVTARDTQSGVVTVVIDLAMLGGSPAQPLFDTAPGDGDTTAADGLWNFDFDVPDSAMGGTYDLVVTVTDAAGNVETAVITITVTDLTATPVADLFSPDTTLTVEGGADRSLSILIGPDTTLSSVTFETRPAPGGAWTRAGQDTEGPLFALLWDLENVPDGDYYVRAIGVRAGSSDSSPSYFLARVVAQGTPGVKVVENPSAAAGHSAEWTLLTTENEWISLVEVGNGRHDPHAALHVPAGARPATETYRIVRRTSSSLGESTALGTDRLTSVSPDVYDFEVDGEASPRFDTTVTVRLFYRHLDGDTTDDELGDTGILLEDLLLHYYDVAAGRWLPVAGQRHNEEEYWIEADVAHFTAYRLLVEAGTATLDSVRIYPNPFVPNDGDAGNGQPYTGAAGTGITFDNVPPGTTIEIYDLAGKRVSTIHVGAGAAGTKYSAIWDVRNDSGRDVASGMYLVVLRSGSSVVTRKVMVVR